MTIDLTGSAPQVRGRHQLRLSVHAVDRARLRAIDCRSLDSQQCRLLPADPRDRPEGTVVNPRPPAAVAARGITGIRIADAIFGALAQAVPDVLPACGSNAPDVGISFGGVDADSNPFVYLEFLLASWGGGPDRDGMDACTGTLRQLLEHAGRNDRG